MAGEFVWIESDGPMLDETLSDRDAAWVHRPGTVTWLDRTTGTGRYSNGDARVDGGQQAIGAQITRLERGMLGAQATSRGRAT